MDDYEQLMNECFDSSVPLLSGNIESRFKALGPSNQTSEYQQKISTLGILRRRAEALTLYMFDDGYSHTRKNREKLEKEGMVYEALLLYKEAVEAAEREATYIGNSTGVLEFDKKFNQLRRLRAENRESTLNINSRKMAEESLVVAKSSKSWAVSLGIIAILISLAGLYYAREAAIYAEQALPQNTVVKEKK